MAQSRRTKGPRRVLVDDKKAFDAACRRSALRAAWAKVWQNAGAAGGDRMTVYDFSARAEARIGTLANDLREGLYHPRPMRHVDIPKRSGGFRRLTISSVVDRIIQTSVATVLMPFFEEEVAIAAKNTCKKCSGRKSSAFSTALSNG
ncbi:retron-type reverse transcriptase [Rhodobium orientis]|uniref:hypothetical protein n=1 Tax=Rhodobium orientis TaxID=34017 RepID=UPI0016199438|nr:hypothetical protein [Rhodobium orientis]MBB4302853.1 retron-type reverse transcriptase [Rhodobium orientis]